MDLVDDVHFILGFRRHEHDFVTDAADIVDTVVTGGVHFDDVEKRAVDDAFTDLAFITWVTVNGVLTVDRTGEDLRDGGLTGASGSAEKIRVTDLAENNGLAKCRNSMFLLDDVVEVHRTVKSVQCDMFHRALLLFKRKTKNRPGWTTVGASTLAAHASDRLLLLPSGPDRVHRLASHKTHRQL